MRLAEAASRNNTVSPTTADGSRLAGGVQDTATGQFASVLSATRRSSQGLMDLLLPREEGPGRRHRDMKAEASSTQAVERSKDAKLQREQAGKPGRAEQLRSLEQERAARATSGEGDQGQIETGDARDGVIEQPVQARPAEPNVHENLGVPLGAWTGPAAEPAGSGQTQIAGNIGNESAGSVSVADPALTGGATTGTSQRGPITGEPAMSGQSGQVNAAGERGTDVRGLSAPTTSSSAGASTSSAVSAKEALVSATSRAGAAVRPGGSAGGEFQNLLQGLGRGRAGEPVGASSSVFAKLAPAGSESEKPVDLRSSDSLRDLARVVQSRIGPRSSSMTMSMSPAELGRLRIDVRMAENVLNVRFQAETPGGLEAIKGKLHELKGVFEQQGVQVDRIEVEFFPQAMKVSPDRDGDGQRPSGEQWQAPADDGQSAGHARQSFDERHDGPADRASAEADAGGGADSHRSLERDWLQSGVDVIA